MKKISFLILLIFFQLDSAFINPNKSIMIFPSDLPPAEVMTQQNIHYFERYSSPRGDHIISKYEYEHQ